MQLLGALLQYMQPFNISTDRRQDWGKLGIMSPDTLLQLSTSHSAWACGELCSLPRRLLFVVSVCLKDEDWVVGKVASTDDELEASLLGCHTATHRISTVAFASRCLLSFFAF